MVYRHARGPASDFVLLFHMAIFFIASGWLLNTKYASNRRSMKKYIKKKFRGLWLPFVGFNVFYVLCNNLFLRINVYSDNPLFLNSTGIEKEYLHLGSHYDLVTILKEILKILFFQGGTELGGALWFFNTLFFLLVLYMSIQFILMHMVNSKNHIEHAQAIIAIFFILWIFLLTKEYLRMWDESCSILLCACIHRTYLQREECIR